MNNDIGDNCLVIFDNPSPAQIRERVYTPSGKSGKASGFVYALECGEFVKIGKTTKPDKRFSQIRHGAYSYGGVEVGRMAISARINNYGEKELELHTKFSKLRKNGTELFGIPFEVAVTELIREGDEQESAMDEATTVFHFERDTTIRIKLYEISKDAIACQILSALLCRVLRGGYNYTSARLLAYATGLAEKEVWDGLSALERHGVINAAICGNMILVKFIF